MISNYRTRVSIVLIIEINNSEFTLLLIKYTKLDYENRLKLIILYDVKLHTNLTLTSLF